MEELGTNGIKIYTFPSGEQPVGELNAKMNVSKFVKEQDSCIEIHIIGGADKNQFKAALCGFRRC